MNDNYYVYQLSYRFSHTAQWASEYYPTELEARIAVSKMMNDETALSATETTASQLQYLLRQFTLDCVVDEKR